MTTDPTTTLTAPVTIADTATIGHQCVLGYPKEARLREWQTSPHPTAPGEPVTIGHNCLVFNQVVLYEGVAIADRTIIDDRVRIGYDSTIGPDTRIAYGAYLCDRISIGAHARIAGFVCDGSIIGDRCTVMGDLVHEYSQPHLDWWEVDEPAPIIHHDSVVGYGAVIVGGTQVGPRSYVAAGAVVTRDVPAEHVVTGSNVHTPIQSWPGRRLQSLINHWTSTPRPVPGLPPDEV